VAAKQASEGQRRYLESLTVPGRLADLTAAEARHLIAFLLGPPPNASRAQQLYLAAMLERLPREGLRDLIGELAARETTTEAQRAPSPPPALRPPSPSPSPPAQRPPSPPSAEQYF